MAVPPQQTPVPHVAPPGVRHSPLASPAMPASPTQQLEEIDSRFTELVAELEDLDTRIEATLAEHGSSKGK